MKRRVLRYTVLGALLLLSAARGASTTSIFAGGGTQETGPANECRLADPFAIDFDSQGNAYICEMTNSRVVRVDARGVLTPFAGTTKKGSAGDGGPAVRAELNSPHHLLVLKSGDVLIADSWNWKIRRVNGKTGTITTFAGTGTRGYAGDNGPADKAQFSGIYCLAVDRNERTLYLADLENRRVRAIDLRTGNVRTIAGNGQKGVPRDGAVAAESPLLDPRAVAAAPDGTVYVLERGGHALRAVDVHGKIRTVAGTGKAGPLTATSDPLAATLRGPKHLCSDRPGNILIVDSENDVIRRFVPGEHRIESVTGTGKRGATFNSDPLRTQLHHPHGVNVDAQGRIYVCDSYNSRVLRIE